MTVPPLYVFCVSEEKYVSHGAVNTDWTTAQKLRMSTWYANYSSRLDKKGSVTPVDKFWWTTIVFKVKMITVDIHDRALGARYVRYKWCANDLCVCAFDHSNIIFLLEHSSVYSHSWIQRVFYNGCSRVLKIVSRRGLAIGSTGTFPGGLAADLARWPFFIIIYLFFCIPNVPKW